MSDKEVVLALIWKCLCKSMEYSFPWFTLIVITHDTVLPLSGVLFSETTLSEKVA